MIKYLFSLFIFGTFFNLFSENFPWSNSRQDYLIQQAQFFFNEQEGKYPKLAYPITKNQLEVIFQLFKKSEVEIIGYGSLIHPASALKTVSQQAIQTFQPIVAFGAKRVFERDVARVAHWGKQIRMNDTGMLNIFPTQNLRSMFNGISMKVDINELFQLTEREIGYDLIPLVTLNWNDAINENNLTPAFFIGYAFSASDQPRQGKIYISTCVNPVPGYSYASMEGAEHYGKAFLNFWIDTTLLADRKTPFILWLKNPQINCDCKKGCLLPTKMN